MAGQLIMSATANSGSSEAIKKLLAELQGEDSEESNGIDRMIAKGVL